VWTFWAAGSCRAPATWAAARGFYRDLLGLAICREFGPPDDPGVVFFPGRPARVLGDDLDPGP
jgi:hypothetical protein